MGPFLTPGAWLAGLTKRTTILCYTQNMKALGLVVLEKIFLSFSHCKSMGANDPRGGAIFDPRSMVGRIYEEDHCVYIATQKYESFGPCGFVEDFLCFSHCKSMELSVVMETRVLIRPGLKPNATFPPPKCFR